jgi:hypothetical protein
VAYIVGTSAGDGSSKFLGNRLRGFGFVSNFDGRRARDYIFCVNIMIVRRRVAGCVTHCHSLECESRKY